jgi:energy-coupling factor transport system permease/ATP-binding protein
VSQTRSENRLEEEPLVARGALVEVRDLTWRPFGRKEPVLSGISLRIEAGSRVLLAGPSGSGKSTLLRALAGVLTTTETGDLGGSVLIDGSPPAGSSVGLMMQDPGDALVAGRVGRDVAFGPENFGMPRSQIWSRVRSALAAVGFPYDEDHPTTALSGGEAQRLALAGVLALTPRLVLLDEPTSMLDPSSAAVVREAILSAVHTSGATLVMVQHRLSDWVGEVDRLVVLDPTGRISVDGPVAATLATSADSLAAQGVWVPGVAPPSPLDVPRALCEPTLPGVAVGEVMVAAESVSVLRQPRASVMSANRRESAVQALLDVSATVGAGEILAVVGPSGAGKSTLTSLLAGVDEPSLGVVRATSILLAGLGVRSRMGAAGGIDTSVPRGGSSPPPDSALSRWSSRLLAGRFGWVPQQAEHAVVARTIRGDVLSTSRLLGLDEDAARTRADGLLEVLGLSALSGADPHHLSGGEQRRLALAGAIAHGPSVLVLDEPSVGQDRLTWSAVAGVVLAARIAGMAVVLATHDPLLIDLADRRITLQAGRIVDASMPQAPAAHQRVQSSSPINKPRESAAAPGTNLGSVVSGTSAAPAPRSSERADDGRPARMGRPSRLPGWSWSGLAGRSGPLSLLLASIVLVFGAPFITDLRAALIAFGVEIALAPVVLGLGRPRWRRLLPGLFAVASVSFSNWLLSADHAASTGALAGLRVAFFVLPGVLLASRIDPSALGDHLAQRLRLPARPVVAAVAALHRFESLGEQWDQLARVRRVRGLGPGRSPLDRGRHIAALTFGLLIQTLRQAGRMAVAMEARGFSPVSVSAAIVSTPHRTWAEPAPWRPTDSLMLALGVAVAGIPLLLHGL